MVMCEWWSVEMASMAKTVQSGEPWRCAGCETAHRITIEETPRSVWYPVRVGRLTGPDGATVAALPVLRLQAA
jgi:hypothetical protein